MWKKLYLLITVAILAVTDVSGYSRRDFPSSPKFVFGAGTSAYQVEGAANEDGRTPSIMDIFAHSGITDGANGDVSCDEYHKYKEDVQLMADMGLEAYRFSISWSRLIPNGRGPVNPKGVEYYNNLINELLSHGIEPHVTLHHSNFPLALEDEYAGWLSRRMVRDFTAYADVCFKLFGDRVKHWTTFNEANVFVLMGYDYGIMAPQRCSSPFGFSRFCTKGDSTTEPYLAAHNIILAHASVARIYKKKYQKQQQGVIGFNLYVFELTPFTNTTEDIEATQRANEFYYGWFVDPLTYGDYPKIMKKNAGSRIPSFTAQESEQIKGTLGFLGINYYFAAQGKNNRSILMTEPRDYKADMAVDLSFTVVNLTSFEFPITPWSLQAAVEYFNRYENLPVYIHESGQRMQRNETLEDWSRVKCLQGYIGAVLDTLRNGSDVRGYFAWSFLDVFELTDGFRSGFGLFYVDLDDPDSKRYPKASAHWYTNFLKGGSVDPYSDEPISLRMMKMNVSSVSSIVV